jgi:ABC-type antimicrobial peptide transport system permease subunit
VQYSDVKGAEPVTVLSAELAKETFNTVNAVGSTITLGDVDYRVVGVVADVKEFTVASQNADGIAYVSYAQTPEDILPASSSIIVRGHGDAHVLGAISRGAIRDVEPRIPIAFVRTMKDMLDIDLLAPRLRTVLIGAFGAIAAMLAALGLLGVTAYGVAQARDEISVRMALGARARQVALQVVRQSLVMAGFGVALGLLLAAAAARALSAFLFGVPQSDMVVLAAVVGGAITIAIIAAWYPARRAANTDPAAVLRSL